MTDHNTQDNTTVPLTAYALMPSETQLCKQKVKCTTNWNR